MLALSLKRLFSWPISYKSRSLSISLPGIFTLTCAQTLYWAFRLLSYPNRPPISIFVYTYLPDQIVTSCEFYFVYWNQESLDRDE